jgi:subfamily B ATP-binding cassette protein MsbA
MALRGEVTVLVVAHRLSTVQDVDTAYVLDKGKIIASGPFSKLRRDVPLIKN